MTETANIYRLTISALGPNGLNENTLNYLYVGASPPASGNLIAQELAQTYLDTCLADYVPLVGPGMVFSQISVRGVDQPQFGADLLITQAGGAGGPDAPYQISPVLQFRTDFIGRRFRGRNRLFPTTEPFLEGSTVAGTYITAALAYGNSVMDLRNLSDEGVGQLLVWSRANMSGELVTSVSVAPIASVQRRRTPGVGA